MTKDEILNKMVDLAKQEEAAIEQKAKYFGVDADKSRAASKKIAEIQRKQDKYERLYQDA